MSGAGDEFIRWHGYRAWVDGDWEAKRPAGVVDPCGDCGRALREHPIPTTVKGNEATAREIIRLRRALIETQMADAMYPYTETAS